MRKRADAGPLPPGTILQRLHLRERLNRMAPGRFVEVGAGRGETSELLLDLGWVGAAYDLGAGAVAAAADRNAVAAAAGRFEVRQADWLDRIHDPAGQTDLVLSVMVLEHLPEEHVDRFFARAALALRPTGRVHVLVPGSPRHWGVEDDVAGHLRRYTRATLREAAERNGWSVDHICGLTWPLSNVLLALSNRLVARAEASRLQLRVEDRTVASGDRDVPLKTSFPAAASLVLNETALRPFHAWQRRAAAHPDALVLHLEARPPR